MKKCVCFLINLFLHLLVKYCMCVWVGVCVCVGGGGGRGCSHGGGGQGGALTGHFFCGKVYPL